MDSSPWLDPLFQQQQQPPLVFHPAPAQGAFMHSPQVPLPCSSLPRDLHPPLASLPHIAAAARAAGSPPHSHLPLYAAYGSLPLAHQAASAPAARADFLAAFAGRPASSAAGFGGRAVAVAVPAADMAASPASSACAVVRSTAEYGQLSGVEQEQAQVRGGQRGLLLLGCPVAASVSLFPTQSHCCLLPPVAPPCSAS